MLCDHWAKIMERGGQNFVLHHKGGSKFCSGFSMGAVKIFNEALRRKEVAPYELINERSLIDLN